MVDQKSFQFPDEAEPEQKKSEVVVEDVEIEIVDDAPPEDRGRKPLPEEQVQALEADDLSAYDDKVKDRLRQLKKVWHDERRNKEAALREREEAIRFAEVKDREVRELRTQLGHGERLFVDEVAKTTAQDLAAAKAALKQAYEAGDSDLIADAHEAMTNAQVRMRELSQLRHSRQQENIEVQPQPVAPPAPPVDKKAEAWRNQNSWFGTDSRMTGFALGLHQELVNEGVDPRSDDYYERVNSTMRTTFPDRFEPEDTPPGKPQARPRAPAVVASVSRTTQPKRIRLNSSQLALAKRFGLTPEAYAREVDKLENSNG